MSEPVVIVGGDAPEVHQASANARATFKYFWRELSWERRRIVPGLDMAMIKLAFTDGPGAAPPGAPEAEQMWVDEVAFDGNLVSGTLINQPSWIRSVQQGSRVDAPFEQLVDWIMAVDGVAHGAHTVNVMRGQMPPRERRAHDAAWGLDFGEPSQVRIAIERDKPKGILASWFGRRSSTPPPSPTPPADHPMCINMLPKYDAQLTADPAIARQLDRRGWTLLHDEALAGNLGMVELLLRHGADPNARTPDGRTAADLASRLGWDAIESLLRAQERRGPPS